MSAEQTPMRPGHRGSADRVRSRITPEHIRQADRNLTRRWLPLWLIVVQEVIFAGAHVALGVLIAYGFQHDVMSVKVAGILGGVALLVFNAIRLLGRWR